MLMICLYLIMLLNSLDREYIVIPFRGMLILKRDEVVSAFADDIAVILENLWVSAPALQNFSKSSR